MKMNRLFFLILLPLSFAATAQSVSEMDLSIANQSDVSLQFLPQNCGNANATSVYSKTAASINIRGLTSRGCRVNLVYQTLGKRGVCQLNLIPNTERCDNAPIHCIGGVKTIVNGGQPGADKCSYSVTFSKV